MAETPVSTLEFLEPGESKPCFGCAERRIKMPPPLPPLGDDFDWRVRDYDGFRQFMLEELAARFPERRRWTPADLEVVLVEILAAMLDQLSDMADRVFAEAYLETARRPDSVRRHLAMIGFDAIAEAAALDQISIDDTMAEEDKQACLDLFWTRNPHVMETAREAGPRAIRNQNRMVSLPDHAERLEDHPLVLRAQASSQWTGSWETVFAAVILWDTKLALDDALPQPGAGQSTEMESRLQKLFAEIEQFNERRRIPLPIWTSEPSIRTILRPYVDRYRMAGREVILQDAVPVGITIIVSVVVNANYYRSEVKTAVAETLGTGPGGFFEPGRLHFGEDLFASDVIAALMRLDGVDNVCLIRFKRSGEAFPDQTGSGRIRLDGLELAVCDNDPGNPSRGYLVVRTNGGMSG